jgi:hypothetical protein
MSARTLVALVMLVASAAPSGQTPARDRAAGAPADAGAGEIRGVVVSAIDPAKPVSGVRVVATGSGRGFAATTGADGRFVVVGVPDGSYAISATKPAYVPVLYGAATFGRPGTTVLVSNGRATPITIPIVRGAVVEGVVRDGRGQPVADVAVAVQSASMDFAGRTLTSSPVRTNDRGEYRLFGLPRGKYFVLASMSSLSQSGIAGRRTVEENDALLAQLELRGAGGPIATNAAGPARAEAPPEARPIAYAPVFYPGTLRIETAEAIELATGAERSGVDLVVDLVPAGSIDGQLSGAVVRMDRVALSLLRPDGHQDSNTSRPVLTQLPDANGRFHYDAMPPGRYTILARATSDASDPPDKAFEPGITQYNSSGVGARAAPPDAPDGYEYLYGRLEVEVNGGATTSAQVTLLPGASASGRVVFAGATAAPDPSGIRIAFAGLDMTSMSMSDRTAIGNELIRGLSTAVLPDGRWSARGIAPARFRLEANIPPALRGVWWLRSAMWNGQDLLEAPLDLAPGQRFDGITFTFTDQHNELTGTLTTPNGRPATEYFVVILPVDPRFWVPNARRIKGIRPLSNGVFSAIDLPEGDYLVAALSDVVPADLEDRDWLTQVAAAGVKVTVAPQGVTRQDLRVVR